jgi:hypothetical protein
MKSEPVTTAIKEYERQVVEPQNRRLEKKKIRKEK